MAIVDDLRGLLGDSGVLVGPDARPYQAAWLNQYSGVAKAVVRPASTDAVSAVVRLCSRQGVAMVPQGGNTGLCGGATPSPDGDAIVISLERMRAIESVDADRFTLTAQAGATIETVQQAAAGQNRLFAPDWGARGTATIGGAIATNAGGFNVLRYGMTRRHVLGIEAVLPDGAVWDGLRSLRKDNTGYDLKQLFIGAEGTLGIVTRAVLALEPAPPDEQHAFAALRDLDALIPLFALARSHARDALTAFELVPDLGIDLVLRDIHRAVRPIESRADWYVLLRLAGPDGIADVLGALLAAAVEGGLITEAVVAATAAQAENLWLIRDELPSTARFDERGHRTKFDVAVPIDQIAPFHRAVGSALTEVVPGALPYVFGHVGDGNLHLSVYPGEGTDLAIYDSAGTAIAAAVDELTWQFGGTISAEHGIGQAMVDRIIGQKSAVELDLMRTIKTALDPKGLMNPGKVVPF